MNEYSPHNTKAHDFLFHSFLFSLFFFSSASSCLRRPDDSSEQKDVYLYCPTYFQFSNPFLSAVDSRPALCSFCCVSHARACHYLNPNEWAKKSDEPNARQMLFLSLIVYSMQTKQTYMHSQNFVLDYFQAGFQYS